MQINLTLGQILNLIEGGKIIKSSALDDSFQIKKISSFEDAQSSDIAFLIDRGDSSVFDNVSLDKVKNSNAGLILASKEVVVGKNYLLVDDPLKAFEKIVQFVQKKNSITGISTNSFVSEKSIIEKDVTVGPGAVIEDNVKVASGSEIGAQVFLGVNVEIGKNVKIFSGAKILHGCIVGDNSIIHSGAVIGSDGYGYQVTKTGLNKIPQVGIVRIGKGVEFGANATVDRAAFGQTLIDDGAKIDNMVHIAHNSKIGKFTAILAQTAIAGSVQIGQGCQIGAQVAIKDHIKIGNRVKIVSKSGVVRDLKDGEIVSGIPAVPFLRWKRIVVALASLPELVSMAKKLDSVLKSNEKPNLKSKILKFFVAKK